MGADDVGEWRSKALSAPYGTIRRTEGGDMQTRKSGLGRIAGSAKSVLPQAPDEQTSPTWVVDGLVNARVRAGSRRLFRAAMDRAAAELKAQEAARAAAQAETPAKRAASKAVVGAAVRGSARKHGEKAPEKTPAGTSTG